MQTHYHQLTQQEFDALLATLYSSSVTPEQMQIRATALYLLQALVEGIELSEQSIRCYRDKILDILPTLTHQQHQYTKGQEVVTNLQLW